MTWDGTTERRKENRKMDNDFNELKTNVAVLTNTVQNWMASTKEYREFKDKQLYEIKDEIIGVKSNCLQHLSNNKLFNQHLCEHKEKKVVFGSRVFTTILLITNFAWALFMFVIGRK